MTTISTTPPPTPGPKAAEAAYWLRSEQRRLRPALLVHAFGPSRPSERCPVLPPFTGPTTAPKGAPRGRQP